MLVMTGEMLLAHLVGDYMFQSNWMVKNKHSSCVVAAVHGFFYSIAFALIIPDTTLFALFLIASTHAIVDRFRLAKYILIARDYVLRPTSEKFDARDYNGLSEFTPKGLSTAVHIIVDNTLHLLINALIYSVFVYGTIGSYAFEITSY